MSNAEADEREWQTRKRRIDPRPGACGWSVVPAERPRTLVPEAIMEYETANGPADYALSVNGQVLGIVEATQCRVGPQNSPTQAAQHASGTTGGRPGFDSLRLPFLYSRNAEVIWVS